jgi:pimeloyl-ACP methyl ester carboxylesterase
MVRIATLILFIVVLVVMALFAFTYWQLHKVVYTHIPADEAKPVDFGLVAEDVQLELNDRKIAGWYFPVENPKGGVVLVHGYGRPKGGKPNMLAHAKYLQDHGWATLAIDLYSFGESDGDKITFGRDEWRDVKVGYEYLKAQEVLRDKPVGLMGISMGGATVLITAGEERLGDFVISSAGYASVNSLFEMQAKQLGYPTWLFRPFIQGALILLLPSGTEPVDAIRKITVPILIMQGNQDYDTNPADANLLREANPDRVTLKTFHTGHDIHQGAPELFESTVINFLESQLP